MSEEDQNGPESLDHNPQFLKERFPGLGQSPEVESAARRTALRMGEPLPKDPDRRIQNYLDRFQEIIRRPDTQARERGIHPGAFTRRV